MSKVIILAPTPPPAGGIAGWTVRMLNATLKNDWIIEVVDEKLLGKTETFGEGSKRSVTDEIKRTINIWYNLKKSLRDPEAKIVHSCIPSTTFAMMRECICAVITHWKKRKFIVHFRCTTSNTTRGKLGSFFLRKLCGLSDHIIVLNKASYNHISDICNTSVEVIPNFVNNDEILISREIRDEIRTVLYVGGVIETKGCRVICEVAKEFPDIQFRLVGKPEKNIAEIAKQIPNVVLTGPLDKKDVKEELQKADLFMFLSYFRGEGFSNALAEAMAYGLPCIVTDWAANSDMIENQGGMIVPIKSVETTINALHGMKNKELRIKQSNFNIDKIQNAYNDKTVLDAYVDCYEKVIT